MLYANVTLESGEYVELTGESVEDMAADLASYGDESARATVYDEPGFVRGYIRGTGSYRAQ